MGVITISINDEIEQQFRESIPQKKKGALGQAFEEALSIWLKTKKDKYIAQEQLQLMKKGIHLGKPKWERGELHER